MLTNPCTLSLFICMRCITQNSFFIKWFVVTLYKHQCIFILVYCLFIGKNKQRGPEYDNITLTTTLKGCPRPELVQINHTDCIQLVLPGIQLCMILCFTSPVCQRKQYKRWEKLPGQADVNGC